MKHLKTHNELRKYCCHICGMLFKTGSYLQYHVHLHDGKKKFSCPHCSKEFHQTTHLKQHIRTHTGEKPYKCNDCEQRFARSSQLTQHVLAIHKKEHKYTCDVCSKGFLNNSNFKAHMMRHNGQRDVKCDVCDKSFVTKNALFRHKRLHTGDKPFACQECGKRFADCSNRKKHMVIYHSKTSPVKSTAKSKEKQDNPKPSEVIFDHSQAKQNNGSFAVIKSFIEPPIVLLAPSNVKTSDICDSGSMENFINGSDLSYKNNGVYVNLSSIQTVAQNEANNNENHVPISVLLNNQSSTDQELYKVSNPYVGNTAAGNLDAADSLQVPEIVQENEQLEIPFPDDLPIFNSITDGTSQNTAYFIPDKELFSQTDVLNHTISSENVTFNHMDIESNYLDMVDQSQKVNIDVLGTIAPCEAQSVMKMLNNEGTILLFPEQDDFSQISEI